MTRPRLDASNLQVVKLKAIKELALLPTPRDRKQHKKSNSKTTVVRGRPFQKGQSGNPGGRAKGTSVKNTIKEARRKALAASGLTPLEFLLSVVRDQECHMDYRVEAARAAAPYCHRKMPIAIEGGDPSKPITFEVTALQGLSVADKMALLAIFEKMALQMPTPRPLIEGVAKQEAQAEDGEKETEDEA